MQHSLEVGNANSMDWRIKRQHSGNDKDQTKHKHNKKVDGIYPNPNHRHQLDQRNRRVQDIMP